ncbi:hypothetical protein [uncultured Lacinutrix sp.]|uniref:hypothetical protein n=1 Tax=uncultured Lacinutrix sp. TaxID=574032 RepID=UPI002632AFED|nr:hypothetical protein [uncultured Lacinutrix sp.]
MLKFLKFSFLIIFPFFLFSCSNDDNSINCNELNIQSPDDNFMTCEELAQEYNCDCN